MTAPELLAESTAQGFCLDVCDEGIGIEPASKLTDAQPQAVREHKVELRILIRGEPSPEAQVTATEKRKRKLRKRVAKTAVQKVRHEEQPPTIPQAALPPAEVAASSEPVEAPAAVERTCCRCGEVGHHPQAERCWHCGGYIDVPVVWG